MKNIYLLVVVLLASVVFTSCEFLSNTIAFRHTAEEFTEALLQEDYDKCMDLFALAHETAKDVDHAKIKASLPEFREVIFQNFGDELAYTLMLAEKRFSSVEGEGTPPNTTKVLVQVENDEVFGVLNILFDDSSEKIININALDIRSEVPNMLPFWIFGLFALCVPLLNIYAIVQIRRSNLKRKWLKYLAVLFFNTPSISYLAMGGLTYHLINFQFMLGIGFGYMGYMNAKWTIGVPLGALYWLWKLTKANKALHNQEEEERSGTDVLDALNEGAAGVGTV